MKKENTTEIVIWVQYGGYTLPQEVLERLKMKEKEAMKLPRTDRRLVKVIKELLKENRLRDNYGELMLAVVEIPADVDWIIQDYDGYEWIAEKHRVWQYDHDTKGTLEGEAI